MTVNGIYIWQFLLLQAGSMLDLTRMLDGGKSFEIVVNPRNLCLIACKIGHNNCRSIDGTKQVLMGHFSAIYHLALIASSLISVAQ